MTVHIVKDQSNQSDRSARRARLAYRSRRRNAFESVGERLNETQRPAGYNYQDIDISGSANVHLGSVINSYTVQGGIQLTQSDVDSLTGPLNVSNAAQGLTLSATKFLVELGKEVYVQQRSELYIALEAFRTLLRRILPASLLSNLTQRRAALIPAVDLVATLTEAVLIFANIEESLSISLDESSGSKKEGLPSHVRLAQQLHAVNEILSMYNSVLSTG
nr:hypothetical protein B0A51_10767 [Rachicladosporium sp. CCFEE 5018]